MSEMMMFVAVLETGSDVPQGLGGGREADESVLNSAKAQPAVVLIADPCT